MKTVSIKLKTTAADVKLNNITEIHYNYDDSGRIAFESDIDGTGYTYAISDIIWFEST